MKKTFVTFGFDHKHTINGDKFDHNCVAVVDGNREDVFRIFGNKFCFEYPEEHWDDSKMAAYWPDGYKQVRECTNCAFLNADCTDCDYKILDKWKHCNESTSMVDDINNRSTN